MKEKESEVMNQSPMLLSEESKTFVCDLWEKDLIELNESLPKMIRELVYFLITHSDVQGVFLGTVEELAKQAEIPLSNTRNGLRVLNKANLIDRKHGITIIKDRRVYPYY